MRKARTWAAFLGVVFLLTVTVSPARADSFRADDSIFEASHGEGHHHLKFGDTRAELIALFPEVFEGNNGLHLGLLKHNAEDAEFENNSGKRLGFSVASINKGNKFGLFKSPQGPQTSAGGTIPNPEPAAVFLLGTGLAAVGAYARKRFRKSKR